MPSREDPGVLRPSGRLLAGAFRQPAQLQTAAVPVGGLPGLIVLNICNGVAGLWHRWKDSTEKRQFLVIWRPTVAFVVGSLSGWLVVSEPSHFPITLATSAFAVVMASTLRLYQALLTLRRREPTLRRSLTLHVAALDDETNAIRRDGSHDAFLVVARLKGAGVVDLEDDPFNSMPGDSHAPAER
jgi:hypothetical protein